MGRNTHGAKHRKRREEAQAQAAAAAAASGGAAAALPLQQQQQGDDESPHLDDNDDDGDADRLDVDDAALEEARAAAAVPADVDAIVLSREQRRLAKKEKRNQRRALEAAQKEAALTPKEQRRLERQQQQAAREAAKEARRQEREARVSAAQHPHGGADGVAPAGDAPPQAPADAPVAHGEVAPTDVDNNDLSLTIFVAGLPEMSARDIGAVFAPHGTVAHVTRLMATDTDTGGFSGMALVRFADDASFHACLALNGLTLDDTSAHQGATLSVKRAKSKAAAEALATHAREEASTRGCATLARHAGPPKAQHAAPLQVDAHSRVVYIGNLSFDVDEASLRAAFPGLDIEAITWGCADPGDPTTFKGYAHVVFATHPHAQLATQANGTDLLGRPMRVAFEVPRRKPRDEDHRPSEYDNVTAIAQGAPPEGAVRAYVTGIPYDADPAAATAALLAALPGAQRVKLGVDAASGAFRGYAHVEFSTPEQLGAAVRLGSAPILGRTVKVTHSREKAHVTAHGPGARSKRVDKKARGR